MSEKRDYLIHAGSIAFAVDLGTAEEALSRREGLQDVHLVRSGPCQEYPQLTRYIVEVHGEIDASRGNDWMDRVAEALSDRVGQVHRCVG